MNPASVLRLTCRQVLVDAECSHDASIRHMHKFTEQVRCGAGAQPAHICDPAPGVQGVGGVNQYAAPINGSLGTGLVGLVDDDSLKHKHACATKGLLSGERKGGGLRVSSQAQVKTLEATYGGPASCSGVGTHLSRDSTKDIGWKASKLCSKISSPTVFGISGLSYKCGLHTASKCPKPCYAAPQPRTLNSIPYSRMAATLASRLGIIE